MLRHYDSFPLAWDKLSPRLAFVLNILTHSHLRGINLSLHRVWRCLYDSLPRTWDKLYRHFFFYIYMRLISTHVGRTPIYCCKVCLQPTHSHACGTNHINSDCIYSPHAIYCIFSAYDAAWKIFGTTVNTNIIPKFTFKIKHLQFVDKYLKIYSNNSAKSLLQSFATICRNLK